MYFAVTYCVCFTVYPFVLDDILLFWLHNHLIKFQYSDMVTFESVQVREKYRFYFYNSAENNGLLAPDLTLLLPFKISKSLCLPWTINLIKLTIFGGFKATSKRHVAGCVSCHSFSVSLLLLHNVFSHSSQGGSSLAEALEPQMSSEERKQKWEQGQADYMGMDSFDNIQKKLDTFLK